MIDILIMMIGVVGIIGVILYVLILYGGKTLDLNKPYVEIPFPIVKVVLPAILLVVGFCCHTVLLGVGYLVILAMIILCIWLKVTS